MGEGRIYGTSYDDGMHREGGYSYARGRRYARRDSMGRYSRDDGMSYARGGRGMRGGYSRDEGKHYMMEQLEEMMEDAEKPAEKEVEQAIQECMRDPITGNKRAVLADLIIIQDYLFGEPTRAQEGPQPMPMQS